MVFLSTNDTTLIILCYNYWKHLLHGAHAQCMNMGWPCHHDLQIIVEQKLQRRELAQGCHQKILNSWSLVLRGGLVVWLACRTRDWEVAGSTPGQCTVRQQLWASCQHPCAPVTKQYNLVLVKGHWCLATGKVTVGLASHWPCVTDFSGLSTYGLNSHGKGDEHPNYAPYAPLFPWSLTSNTVKQHRKHTIIRDKRWKTWKRWQLLCKSWCLDSNRNIVG